MSSEIIITTQEEAYAALEEIKTYVGFIEVAAQEEALPRALNPDAPRDLQALRTLNARIAEYTERIAALHAAIDAYTESKRGV